MSERKAASELPEPMEGYVKRFDDLFTRLSQREGFRQYLVGLLLPAERNKTLTGLVNAEPVVGVNEGRVQSLQWFLSESRWDEQAVNERRLELLLGHPELKPKADGVLVIDETGDRKDGKHTAHVGRQYLANLGKIENGVVSVSSLWADAERYYPLEVEPYTPADWFEAGKADPAFRTKPQIASQLVRQAQAKGIAFRAVVADSFYGENRAFRADLERLGLGYVLAFKPSHDWWHAEGEIGSLREYAQAQPWRSARQPGAWHPVLRRFRDGHEERWWVLDVQVPHAYGPEEALRVVVATPDPRHLPENNTWYLASNLPAPDSPRAASSMLEAADLAEIVRLYGLRIWIEQSYKHMKHSLGWAQYQVRSDRAIRRHWTLVLCAFTFCWWHAASSPLLPQLPLDPNLQPASTPSVSRKKGTTPSPVLAASASPRPLLVGALHHAQTLLDRLLHHSAAPTSP